MVSELLVVVLELAKLALIWKANQWFLGQCHPRRSHIPPRSNGHPKNYTLNIVNIVWAAVAGTGDNAYTSTLTITPNLNASLTGSGPTGFTVPADMPFGCVDFRTYNLNFINDYAPLLYAITSQISP